MANYSFNLRNPKSLKRTPVNLIIRYNNQRLVYPSGEKITPKFWRASKMRAKETVMFSQHSTFNESLDNIRSKAEAVFMAYKNSHDHEEPAPAQLRALLDIAFKRKKAGPRDLFSFIDLFIEQSSGMRSASTISWYRLGEKALKEFKQKKKHSVTFETIDLEFYYKFCEFLAEKKYTNNTIGKYIQVLKTFLNEATERGLNKNLVFRSKKFKKISEEVDHIYLTEDELDEIYSLDLSGNLRLDRVRDLFIVGCWTGLRFSDFSTITKENIDGDSFKIRTRKTGERVVIPLHPAIKEIMVKYKDRHNSLPPSISNRNLNAYIKEVTVKAKLLQGPVSKTITRGAVERTVQYPKWKLVSSHTCRRSFATNLFKGGLPSLTIMMITGHKSESAFMKYIKVTPEESALALKAHWSKTYKLRSV